MRFNQIIFTGISVLKYYINAKTKFNIQSPFLHQFVEDILDNKREYYAFQSIEIERKKLLHDQTIVECTDFGAGSIIKSNFKKSSIRKIAILSLSKPTQCKILFHLARFTKAKKIIELGTSLGISTAYLASGNTLSKVDTFEGDPLVAAKADNVFKALGIKNVSIHVGNFHETLPQFLSGKPTLDLVFIDGHHKKETTLSYFYQILENCHEKSIILIDDIHWSRGMTEAWNIILQHKKVTLSVDIFSMGIVFINPTLSRENIAYIPYLYKPWNIGLFGN
ncbi:MAG: class I SAM-dependent methyltransferase [Saprospiraceae bacterium]